MIQIFKKQGLKAALPLLLLATACGEGAPTVQSDKKDTGNFDTIEEVVKADTSIFEGGTDVGEALNAAIAKTEAKELATDNMATLITIPPEKEAEKIPEPMTLAGLAVAALGLGTLKRKQSA